MQSLNGKYMDLRWYKQVHSLTQNLRLTPNPTRAEMQICCDAPVYVTVIQFL